jgi:rhodanese-related sulfurtransferase
MATQVKRVSVQEAYKAVSEDNKSVMIDVRELDEIAAVAPAIGIVSPMSAINLESFGTDHGLKKDQPIYLFCRSGNRSMRVGMALADHGFTNLSNVEGGIIAWQAAGLPLKK